MNTMASASTPTNSATAYRCTLPDLQVLQDAGRNARRAPAPFTMPSITLRSNQHHDDRQTARGQCAAPLTTPSSTFWLNQ